MDNDVTSTRNNTKQNLAEFETLSEALDYAATGVTGANFYAANGQLTAVLPYRELRRLALQTGARLSQLGLPRGAHIALVADTGPDFMILFFACQYAGLVPFAMPVPTQLGSRAVYIEQLRSMLTVGQARVAIAPGDYLAFLEEAAAGLQDIRWLGAAEKIMDKATVIGIDEARARPPPPHDARRTAAMTATITTAAAPQPNGLPDMTPNSADEPAYLQFTSGSTRSPQAVVISGRAVMHNLRAIIRHGLAVQADDRCASWLPFYHDMGLVGFMLGPVVSQLSVDYLRTRDFAVRPLQWLRLISRNRCSIAFAPPFGYELCTRRVRPADAAKIDLSCWRIAGVGAEMIRPDVLHQFAEAMAGAGFDAAAFLPCYGLAEVSLATSFSQLGRGLDVMAIDARVMAEKNIAVRVQSDKRKVNHIVNCGRAIAGHAIKIVNEANQTQAELRIGRVLVKGPSVMDGYLNDADSSGTALQADGWLDTGDLGYLFEGELYLTGRAKDIIIVNGRNIRAQDLEELAEQQPGVRIGSASAFGIDEGTTAQLVVLVVECRLTDESARQTLISRLQAQVYKGFGIRCYVDLVAQHTLPRTSSGKLSRVAARQGFIERVDISDWQRHSELG